MRGAGRLLLAGLALVVLLAGAAAAQDRPLKGVALVVGQSAYRELGPLPNPANDARAVDRLLTDLGFDVVSVTDADQKKLSRALRRFEEDAEGADVALVYYSGHGIEAGGENFLVPVDAGLTSLDDAAERLVPVSRFLEALQEVVPVTIVLLDACRSNPFPADAVVRLEPGGDTAPVTASGLGAPRGAAGIKAASDAPDGLGALVGFAAAPGHVALDGDPGANSPYAAALLKHLSAGGFAFGDVMTMVTEEVYLKTSARQVPWTNSSLRRTLYFGASVEDGEGDDAAIRGERRKLLLTMARIGEPERKQVAAAAQEGGVPMDALFAMLNAVGADMPTDPEAIGRLLQEQSVRLKAIIAERETMTSADPELQRLSALAGDAVLEGALESAISLHQRAKTRVASLATTVDDAEAALRAKRIEFAKVFAGSAETYALAFDHARAAADFAEAYAQAARWDDALALRYKIGEAKALTDLGYYRGDNAALRRAAEAYRQAAALAPPDDDASRRAADTGLAVALWSLGEREGGNASLEESARLLAGALAGIDRAADPDAWATTSGDLAYVLMTLGQRDADPARIEQAVERLGEAVAASDRTGNPLGWARLQTRFGSALLMLGQRRMSLEPIRQAAAAFRAALEERRRETVPLDWAQTTNNLAIALATLGERDPDPAQLLESVELYRGALDVHSRERTPLLWAEAQSNLGTSLFALAGRGGGAAYHREAVAAFRLALEEITRERSPLQWAALQDNLGLALSNLGEAEKDVAPMREAIDAFGLALQERTRERAPLDWATTQGNLANSLYRLGVQTGSPAEFEKAFAAYDAALQERTRERVPLDWARTRNNKGNALYELGMLEKSVERLKQAAAEYRAALEVRSRADDPLGWARSHNNVGQTLLEAGKLAKDKALLAEARVSLEAARDVYLSGGMTQYQQYFELMFMDLDMADLDAMLAEKLKAAQ